MAHSKKKHWRLKSVLLVVLGLLLYLGLVPMQQPPVTPTIYDTVYNDSGRVLKTLSVTVGQRVYDIGPLPPGGSLPFHFLPEGEPHYTVTGSFGEGGSAEQLSLKVPIGPPPYPKAILRINNEAIKLNWLQPKQDLQSADLRSAD